MRSTSPQIHRAAEALKAPPPIEWIVEPIFSFDSVNLVVGNAGSKKTYTLMDAAVCVACGRDWLGMNVRQAPTLFIDEESGERRMLRRLHKILNGHAITKDIPLYFTTLEQFNFRDVKQIRELEKIIRETGAKFVIIDALADVILGADENSAKEVLPVFNLLRATAQKYNCCIIIIHHNNRSGSYRGSSSIIGAVDLMLSVESKKGEVKFESVKERDVEEIKFSASVEFISDNKVIVRATDAQVKLSEVQNFALTYIKRHPHKQVIEIQSRANGYSAESVRRAVYDLRKMKLIERSNPGDKGKPATYAFSR